MKTKSNITAAVLAAVLAATALFAYKAKATPDCDVWHVAISPAPSGSHTDKIQNSDGSWTVLAPYPTLTVVASGQAFSSTLPSGNPGPGGITTLSFSSYYDACSDGTRHWQNGSIAIPGVPAGAKSCQWHWQGTPPGSWLLVLDHITY
jgi:hypothetical protein